MVKSCFVIGVSLHGVISGLWSLGESQGEVWFPLIIAFVGVVPIAAGWANAFVNGESAAS